ncbi:MAG: CARDB domain-containing protein [Candidatus Peregrinibacteria bacterium]
MVLVAASFCMIIAVLLADQNAGMRAWLISMKPEAEGQGLFHDAVPDWAFDAIKRQVKLGIIQGYNDGRFGAGDPVTRGQVVTLLYRILRHQKLLTVPKGCWQYFDDVESTHYAYTPLCAFQQHHMVTETMLFDPDVPSSRGQTAWFIHRALGLTLLKAMGKTRNDILTNGRSFPDVPLGSSSYEAVMVMEAAELMVGYPNGSFGPRDQLNRAQAAVIMSRLLDMIEEKGITEIVETEDGGKDGDSSHGTASSSISSSSASSTSQTSSTSSSSALPDLIVEGIGVSTNPIYPGFDYALTSYVTNTGHGLAAASHIRFFIDRDRNGTNDFVISRPVPALDPGERVSVKLSSEDPDAHTWTLPSGDYSFRVCADEDVDADPEVTESDETNNCSELFAFMVYTFSSSSNAASSASSAASSSSVSSAAPLPDLSIKIVNLYVWYGDKKVDVNVEVHVTGGTSTESFAQPQYQLSGTTQWVPTAELKSVPPLGDGWMQTNYWLKIGLASGGGFPAGTHNVRVCVDVTSVIAESNEANNCSDPFIFSFPDLSATTVNTTPLGPGRILVGASVLVVGKTTAESFIRLQYKLAGTSFWTTTGTDQSIPPFADGGSATRLWSDVGQASGQGFPTGVHAVRVCVDVHAVIDEWDEGNNCSGPISFTIQ